MDTRTDWRIVAVSAGVSVMIIVVTFVATPRTHETTDVAEIVAADAAPTNAAWRDALATIAPAEAGVGNMTKPSKELPPAQAMTQDLLYTYIQYKKEGTLAPSEVQQSVEHIVSQYAPDFTPHTYGTSDLALDAQNNIITYAGALTGSLERSTSIKEHELRTFARSIGEKNTSGSQKLAEAASVYASIESDLARMRVPADVATEHLEVLNSTAMLAYVTDLMSTWNGDPFYGLAFIDQFLATERDVQLSISALYRKLGVIAQKS